MIKLNRIIFKKKINLKKKNKKKTEKLKIIKKYENMSTIDKFALKNNFEKSEKMQFQNSIINENIYLPQTQFKID